MESNTKKVIKNKLFESYLLTLPTHVEVYDETTI